MDSSSTSRAPPFPPTTTTTAAWPDLPILNPASEAPPPAKEHMFDKVVTPSDVGKLNRLVIPKQHAEKYFPLDSSAADTKGLLLNFEDRHGKPWRFRYSYWNSSQSYVMTKGWSRFVKDKKLDAGDIVSFARGASASNRDHFYIDWRRRPDAPPPFNYHHLLHHRHPNTLIGSPPLNLYPNYHAQGARDWGRVVGCYNGNLNYNYNYGMVSASTPNLCHHGGGSVIYLGAGGPVPGAQQQWRGELGRAASDREHVMVIGGAVEEEEAVVFDSVPVVQGGKSAGKRLRLFGVNMDCCEEEEEQKNRHHVQLHDFGLDSEKGKSPVSLDLEM